MHCLQVEQHHQILNNATFPCPNVKQERSEIAVAIDSTGRTGCYSAPNVGDSAAIGDLAARNTEGVRCMFSDNA